jgi:DNA-binding MarR family transcriptional regulator
MTSGELRVWRALIDATAELRRILGAQLQGVEPLARRLPVMLALSEADGRSLRSSQLAASIDWERRRLSHHLRRMERRGLVRRDSCATRLRERAMTPAPRLAVPGAGQVRNTPAR